MKKLNLIDPVFLLRIGLGGVFIYAGASALTSPSLWIGFVPSWISLVLPPALFLTLHSVFELFLGLSLLFGFVLPLVSLVAFFDLFTIMLFYGVDSVTFRDFGLLMAALSLFVLARPRRAAQ